MSKYKYFVFDFDLTLADSSAAILMCFKHVLNEFGYPMKSDREIYNTIGLTLVDGFDILTDTPNNPQREELRKAYVKKADEVMVKHTYFYDDTIAVLQTLKHADRKVGIVSTKYRYRIEQTFEQQAGSMPVDIIVGGEDVTEAKPDPQGLNLIIERFGADKADVLYIGDSYIDAETAKRAGVDFVGVTTGSTTLETFETYPHIYIGKSILDIFLNI